MNLTIENITSLYSCIVSRAELFLPWLNQYMPRYEIDTPARMAAFLAQVGHESGRLRYVEEIATGVAYERRKDLGNLQRGDGRRFKGRGLIQITGRANYTEISRDTGIDFIADPVLLCEPEYAVMSACWFWKKRNLNVLADTGDFKTITIRINGGLNGYEDRFTLWERAKKLIK